MAKLTDGKREFLHDEPNVGVVAALREDGTPHQTRRLGRLGRRARPPQPDRLAARSSSTSSATRGSRCSRHRPQRSASAGSRSKGRSSRSRPTAPTSTSSGRRASTSARTTTRSRPGEQRVLVRIAPERVEATTWSERYLRSARISAGRALARLDGAVQVALEVDRRVLAGEEAVALAPALHAGEALVLADLPVRVRALRPAVAGPEVDRRLAVPGLRRAREHRLELARGTASPATSGVPEPKLAPILPPV